MTVKPHFQILIVAVLVLFSYGIVTWALPQRGENMKTATAVAGDPLPEAVFYDVKTASPMTLDDFKGQVLLVNLWATWCPPCVQELPALDTLQAKLKDKNFRVIAISLDRGDPQQIARFLDDRHIEQLDIYWDKDRNIPAKWVYEGIPTSFLIDGEGRVVERIAGAHDWDKGVMFDKIKALLQ